MTDETIEPRYRAALLVGAIVCFAASVLLFFGRRHTRTVFAWPMHSPVVAVSLAAGLFAGAVLLQFSGLEDAWHNARIGVVILLVATAGLLVATVLSRHELSVLNAESARSLPVAGVVAAIWWIALPVLLIGAVASLTTRRADAVPSGRLLPVWARVIATAQGVATAGLSAFAFGDPGAVRPRLPFAAGTLDVRCVAAINGAIGVALLCAGVVGDLRQARASLLGLGGFVVVEVVGLAWHHHDVAWGSTGARTLIGYLTALFATAVVGAVLSAYSRA